MEHVPATRRLFQFMANSGRAPVRGCRSGGGVDPDTLSFIEFHYQQGDETHRLLLRSVLRQGTPVIEVVEEEDLGLLPNALLT